MNPKVPGSQSAVETIQKQLELANKQLLDLEVQLNNANADSASHEVREAVQALFTVSLAVWLGALAVLVGWAIAKRALTERRRDSLGVLFFVLVPTGLLAYGSIFAADNTLVGLIAIACLIGSLSFLWIAIRLAVIAPPRPVPGNTVIQFISVNPSSTTSGPRPRIRIGRRFTINW